jgi:16S rRNA (cytosine1402-N4)-methyltransferase
VSTHISVLLPESLKLLDIRDGGTYVDLTLGRAGTSAEILKRLPHGKLISFDMDEEAIEESRPKLAAIGTNFMLVHSNFADFKSKLADLGITSIDGLTMDLGVSSPQFDDAKRGFSYKEEAPLDMRMDERNPLTAEAVVNSYSLEDLIKIFREYGEDPDAVRVAKAILSRRAAKPIVTTTELADLIKEAKPMSSLLKKGHPAKQIFQAIRIEVNDELGNLRKALNDIPEAIAPDGTVAIISFHSLEDRLVKEKFRSLTIIEGSRHSLDLLPSEIAGAPFVSLTKKPIAPSEEEMAANHRSTSAKLRAIRKKAID